MTFPPQSPEISSTNFWPKPVEPRGFGSDDDPALRGPERRVPARGPAVLPRALRAAVDEEDDGVLLRRVEHRGLDSQYCTRVPPAPGTDRLSGVAIATSFRQERFSSVRALAGEEDERRRRFFFEW